VNFDQFNLDPRLSAGINRLGYTTPTPVQLAAIPAALAGNDLIATAQTGTGKTAVFVLPILNKLLTGPRNRTRALIVTPTRELAEQIHEAVRDLGTGTKLRCVTIYGGVGAASQTRALRDGVEILVACPGRLLDHIQQGHARLDGVEFLVLDEADRMLDMGFLPDVKRILQHIPAKRQTMLFSATFPREIEQLAGQTLHHPKRIAIGLSRPAHTVTHALYPVHQHLKTSLLLDLLKQTDTDSVLIFTRTKHRAEKLSRQIGQAGFKATSLHSDRTQGQRQIALSGFRSGQYQIMVATDIAARGLDVQGISHVINYDMPATADDYIHRIGRTGRAEHTGDAFTLVTPDDNDVIRALEKIMGKPLPRQTLEGFDYDIPAPEISPSKGMPAFASREPRRTQPAYVSTPSPKGRPASRQPQRRLRQKFASGRTR
jgi:ATP-dependent RNA helicase RhlE